MRCTILLLVGMLLGSCERYSTAPLPLGVSVQADRTTAAPGDSIQFEVRAQGSSLLGIEISFADGDTVFIAAMGAQTVRALQRHAYDNAGVYDVTAVATEATSVSRSATVTVRIE
jgi:hypothetical protein